MIFLTGGTGFVGGHLLVQLILKGKKVRALKRVSGKTNELKRICDFYQVDYNSVNQKIEWVTGDLNDIKSLEKAMENADEVYHCAAIVSFSPETGEEIKSTNIDGSRNIAKVALSNNVKVFCYVSSIGALGHAPEGTSIDENTLWDQDANSSAYSKSKYDAEQEIWKVAAKGLKVIIVNPGIILGAGNFEKGSLRFFSKVRMGMPFYTDQQSGYVDVRDVCNVLLMLREKNIFNERFVLVSENLSNRELFTYMAYALGKRPPFIHIGPAVLRIASTLSKLYTRISGKQALITPEIARSATKKSIYSSRKIQELTGYQFIPMQQCIEETIKGKQDK